MTGRALDTPRDAGDRGCLEAYVGKMQSNGLFWQNAEQSWASCLGCTRPAILSLEEHRSEVKLLLREVRSRLPCAVVRGDHQEPRAGSLSWWSPLEGYEDPLR